MDDFFEEASKSLEIAIKFVGRACLALFFLVVSPFWVPVWIWRRWTR